jgi:hypothetical protein
MLPSSGPNLLTFTFIRKWDATDTRHQDSVFSGPLGDAKRQRRKDIEAWFLVKVTKTL